MSDIVNFLEELGEFGERVKQLAQIELGCGCPEHVYEQIRILRGEASPGKTDVSIVVGEQLLVLFGKYDRLEPFDYEMPRLILSGVTYRDSMGLNRFRLILSNEVTEEERKKIEAEIKKYDEKVHVHYLD